MCTDKPTLVCVYLSGAPGSGRTTLMREVIVPALRRVRCTVEVNDHFAAATIPAGGISKSRHVNRILDAADELATFVIVNRAAKNVPSGGLVSRLDALVAAVTERDHLHDAEPEAL